MHTLHRRILLGAFCGLCGFVSSLSVSGQSRKPVTLDDLMKLRSIVDVRIAPQGDRIAYVVSTPSLTRNQHEAALYLVPSSGGAPRRLAETLDQLCRMGSAYEQSPNMTV